MDAEFWQGLIDKQLWSFSAIGLTQVFSSPGPLETKTITSLVSLDAADFLEFKALNYADGETWTRKAEATRSLDVRVYQFHHIR